MITVAICTLNRAESLRCTLDSLRNMEIPYGLRWETLIVNNGCTDHTTEVVKSFEGKLPIREELQLKRGLSAARNHAVTCARGNYVIWTDDDVIVDRFWLRAYSQAFDRWPDGAVFGGPIIPKFSEPASAWAKLGVRYLSGPYAIRNFEANPSNLNASTNFVPYGANYAVKIKEQRLNLYDETIGPGTRFYGEEVDVIERMLAVSPGYWVHDAKVEHCIGRERQRTEYLFKYWFRNGDSEARIDRKSLNCAHDVMLFGAPRWMWRACVSAWLRYRLARMSGGLEWIPKLREYAMLRGKIYNWRHPY